MLLSGGSLGGLATGIALSDAGHEATIYERSSGDLHSRGGGIVAQANIRRFLDQRTDCDPADITTRSSERVFLTDDGDVERTLSESMTFTSWDALYRQLRAVFPDDRYHSGREVTRVEPDTATAAFADGTELTTDLVVAAEGGQSTTRRHLFPETGPSVADYAAWRGVVPETDLSTATVETFDDRFVFYQGAGQLMLAYFIPGPDGETSTGARRLNWVWYDRLDGLGRSEVFTDTTGTERRYTVPPGRLRDSVRDRRLRRANSTLPPVFHDILAATPDLFVQAIYDLTVPEMVADRVCLLGDAAFVARPHTAAGTAKAVADGTALAAALRQHDSVADALASWNEARTAYGSQLVARGKRMGDERLGLGG